MLNKYFISPVFLSILIACVLSIGCRQEILSDIEIIKLPTQSWMDSVRQSSDTVYTKFYQGADFLNAEYFVNRKDSIITQLMKDTAGNISQIITVKKQTRTALAPYHPNGQLMAKYFLDDKGKFDSSCRYYYEDGRVKAEGLYQAGFRTGSWKNYDSKGLLMSTDTYDANGQMIESKKRGG